MVGILIFVKRKFTKEDSAKMIRISFSKPSSIETQISGIKTQDYEQEQIQYSMFTPKIQDPGSSPGI
jgi:hypothetical protein